MDFLLFILASIGLTFIVTLSFLFKGFRERMKLRSKMLHKLFSCTMCFGFWSGLFVQSIIMLKNGIWENLVWGDVHYIIYGFISSFVCYLVYLLMCPLIKKYD